MAVLMITSDLPELLGMSDRVVVMREGRVAGELPGGCSASEVMGMAMGSAGSEVGG
jgi:ribose transport system ATP-binding protein